MRIARWLAIVLAALVLLVAAALVAVTLLINPDRYRGRLQRAVSDATGRPFVIEGHLHLTWFPWLGVKLGPARLGAAPGHPGPDLIDWRSAQLSVRLLPLLLHRQVIVGPIHLEGAVIHLWREPDGYDNWQDLLRSRAGSPSATSTLPVVGGLELTDGTLDFDSPGQHFSLTRWQLAVSAWEPGEPLTVRTRFVLQGSALPKAVPIALQAERLRIGLAPLTVTAPKTAISIGSATLEGSATAGRDAGAVAGQGNITLTIPSVRDFIGQLGLKLRLPKDPGVLGPLALNGSIRLRHGVLAIQPLTLRLDATTLTGWVDHTAVPDPRWTFSLAADQIDVRRYLPPTRAHPKPFALPIKALRAIHAEGSLTVARATFDKTTMRDIRLQVQ